MSMKNQINEDDDNIPNNEFNQKPIMNNVK